jgi:hypothetical protein
MKWLARLFSSRNTAASAPAAAAPEAPPLSAPVPVAEVAAEPAAEAPAFLPWLLGCAPLTAGALTGAEQRALNALDKTLALATLPDELLPRAAALIPQLLAMLRQSDLPVPALAQRVAKDVVLTAEVMRLASSPYYRAHGAVEDLSQAIARIGITGLNTVIARVVLKPIYESAPGPLSARSSARLWEYSQALASHAGAEAARAGLSSFDGYLAGLLHGSGWTIALRVIDRANIAVPLPPTADFAAACAERAHRLFGLTAQRWAITPGFSELGADAREQPLASSRSPLAAALRRAQPLALAEIASAPAKPAATGV